MRRESVDHMRRAHTFEGSAQLVGVWLFGLDVSHHILERASRQSPVVKRLHAPMESYKGKQAGGYLKEGAELGLIELLQR